jgi:hypothetical protein
VTRRSSAPRFLFWWTVLAALAASGVVKAEDFIVPSTATPAIADAVDRAKANQLSGDRIFVSGGPYGGNLTIEESLTIEAVDGAKVELTGAPDTPVIEIRGPSITVSLHRLILTTSGTGVRIENATANLRNLVIRSASLGVDCRNAVGGEIVQTTFYQVATGIACQGSSIAIKNNIFATVSGIPISLTIPGTTSPIPSYNLFFDAPTTGDRGDPVVVGDPRFVDPNQVDFHLRSGSPAIDAGDPSIKDVAPIKDKDATDETRSDIGAYGGQSPGAHTKPYPPQDVGVACVPESTTCTVSWTANLDYGVSGYRVFLFSPQVPSSTTATGSETNVTTSVCPSIGCSIDLTNLDQSVSAPDVPTGLTVRSGDGRLLASWNPVAGATLYRVLSGTSSGTGVQARSDVTATQDVDIPNLDNGTTYFVSVQAIREPTLTAEVGSLYGTDVNTTTTVSLLSPRDSAPYGTPQFSSASGEVTGTPQLVVAFPPLENAGGCFIATAAYGSALAPQVEVLRTWRDRYLAPHAPGRAFIAAYQTWSPPVADLLRRSEPLRALVRVLLLPIVGIAWVWVQWPWVPWVVVLGVMMCWPAFHWMRRGPARG